MVKTVIKLPKYILLLAGTYCFAQQPVKDTVSPVHLDEVVVTGQFEPQSIKKSVQNVRIIKQEDIKQLGANNLSDVLNQYINITVRPSGNDGRSTVSMFGLDGQYFKILIDNVPIVNEAGLGNNIDLSQINLNDVERIEIIEGSMGVTHGANAVSGILNIITKKSSSYKWEVQATVQEETVGNEYALFDKGRHIQALKVSHSISDNWFVSLNANRNDFTGWLDNRKGKDHFLTDSLRGYQWLPKEQLITNALVGYNRENLKIFYRFEYLDENISYYNPNVEVGFNTEIGSYRVATDRRFATNRFYHHLNASGKLFSQLNYNVSVSHQKQTRDAEEFRYFIQQDMEQLISRGRDQSMEVLYSIGTVSNLFKSKVVDLQLGYEFVNNNGLSTEIGQGQSTQYISERLENYDFFVSSEVNVSDKFSLRPGFRYSFQSQFDNQTASSLGMKYQFDNGMQLRGAIGQSYRTPTFEELYMKLIFSGHYFTGNENLIPENSMSYEASVRKTSFFDSGITLSNNIAASYIDITDRITSTVVGFDGATPMYEFMNISNYSMWNASTTNQVKYKNWNVNIGATLIGISQQLDENTSITDGFLYTLNLNTSVAYRVPSLNAVFAVYYKYNGAVQEYQALSNEFATIEATNWLDASASKTFFNNALDVQLGARNIMDITNVNRVGTPQSGSHASSTSILSAYGRSYYLRLTYNLNI